MFWKKNAICLHVSDYKWSLALPEELIPYKAIVPV